MLAFINQNKSTLRIIFWLWLIFIAVVSSLPNIPTQKINIWDEPFRLDYLEHFGVFVLLMGVFVLWKSDESGFFSLKKQLIFVLGILVFAVVDELHQLWIPGRSYNPLDLIYNLLGCITALFLTRYILKRMANSKKRT